MRTNQHSLFFIDLTAEIDTCWFIQYYYIILMAISVNRSAVFINNLSLLSNIMTYLQHFAMFVWEWNKTINLTLPLFNIFINDLLKYINNEPFDTKASMDHISILLYAGDIVLLGDSCEHLKKILSCLDKRCCRWKISVNTSKIKCHSF